MQKMLFEKDDLNLKKAFDLAFSVDRAQKQSLKYFVLAIAAAAENTLDDTSENNHPYVSVSTKEFFTIPAFEKSFFFALENITFVCNAW